MDEEKGEAIAVKTGKRPSVDSREGALRPFSRRAALPLFVVSFCLMLLGQIAIFLPRMSAAVFSGPIWKTLAFLPPYYTDRCRVSLALIFFGASGLLFAVIFALGRVPSALRSRGSAPSVPLRRAAGGLGLRCWLIVGVLAVVGTTYEISLVMAIRRGGALERPFEMWLLSLFTFAVIFYLLDRWFRRGLRNPLSGGEWIFIVVATLAAVALCSFDLLSYKYAFIGDEFSFYTCARDILLGKSGWKNIFSEEGVYGYHPRLSTYYQAAVMKVFGMNNFGWRFSSVLAAAACLLPFYVFLKLALSRRAAVWGTLFLCFSHYALTFAHMGYNNNHVVFPVVLALCLFALADRCGSSLGFFLCGAAAGMGFFTFYSSRIAVVFIAGMFIIRAPGRSRARWLLFFLFFILGFTMTVAPLILPRPARFVDNMRKQSVLRDERGSPDEDAGWHGLTREETGRMKRNTLRTLLSPIYFAAGTHFVSGTLLDAVTSSFFVLGLFYALFRVFGGGIYVFLLAAFVFSATVLGTSTPYATPPVTRMLFIVPLSCMIAALGAERFFAIVEKLTGRRRGILWLLAAAAAGSVIWMNLYRMHVEAPAWNGVDPQSLVIRYLKDAPGERRHYFLLPDDWGDLIEFHVEFYNVDDKVDIYRFGEVIDDPFLLAPPCTVIFNDVDPAGRNRVIDELGGWFYVSKPEAAPGPGGKRAIYLMEVR